MANATKRYTPSEAVVNNSNRGKAYKKKKTTTRSSEAPYEMVSKNLEQGFSLTAVKQLYAFLNKQKDKINKYNIDTDGDATWEYLDWLEAGGHAAYYFCQKVLHDNLILKSSALNDYADLVEDKDKWSNVSITKAIEPVLKQATFLALSPEEADLHEDIYSAEEIRKGCHSFNAYCRKANLLHLFETDAFSIVESYISPVDMVLGETFISKGSWLTVLQFHDDDLWTDVVKGNFTGISVGCFASVQVLEESDND